MELKNKDGMWFVHEEEVSKVIKLKDKALKVRLSIIRYNRSKDENSLNSCCRNCNDLIQIIDEVFKCGL